MRTSCIRISGSYFCDHRTCTWYIFEDGRIGTDTGGAGCRRAERTAQFENTHAHIIRINHALNMAVIYLVPSEGVLPHDWYCCVPTIDTVCRSYTDAPGKSKEQALAETAPKTYACHQSTTNSYSKHLGRAWHTLIPPRPDCTGLGPEPSELHLNTYVELYN